MNSYMALLISSRRCEQEPNYSFVAVLLCKPLQKKYVRVGCSRSEGYPEALRCALDKGIEQEWIRGFWMSLTWTLAAAGRR